MMLVLLYFNSLVMVGVGIIRTSLAGPTMSLIYTKIPGIWAKCGAMLGSLVKARYLYGQSKSRCKYAIRYIKRHENSLRKESLARKLVDKNPIEFWKEVKHMNANNTPLPTCID